jgi:hypothetical protein
MFFFSIFDFTKVAIFLAEKTHFIPKGKINKNWGNMIYPNFFARIHKICKSLSQKIEEKSLTRFKL